MALGSGSISYVHRKRRVHKHRAPALPLDDVMLKVLRDMWTEMPDVETPVETPSPPKPTAPRIVKRIIMHRDANGDLVAKVFEVDKCPSD
jgi:hypothetical protein